MKRPKAKGRGFEAMILDRLDWYAAQNIARVRKVNVRMAGGRYVEKAPADFVGYYCQGGRHILFECKENKKRNLPLLQEGHDGDGVKWHQAQALFDAYMAGCFSALLWLHNGTLFVIPGWWPYSILHEGGKSISAQEIIAEHDHWLCNDLDFLQGEHTQECVRSEEI